MSIGEKLGEVPAQTKIAGATVAGSLGLGTLGTILFADWRPYFVAFLVMVILGAIAWFSTKYWERVKKKRDAARFSEGLDDGLGDDAGGSGTDKAEQERLRRKFLEGVTEYQRAGISVYDSPWLVLVGPPSAGKTVLLQKCGLVDAKDLQQGVGGTQGMNWWFIDADAGGEPLHAVVLDMAGAVFMDQRQEGRWETFLKFLKQHRKYEPLNGIMLVVSVQDLIGKTPELLAQEGGQVRNQLEKIRAQLDIRFPVWVIVTKCDLVDGFKEFTEAIERAGAGQMLGWSKPGKLDAPFEPKAVKEFIDGIVERLRVFRSKVMTDMITGPSTGERQSDRADTLFGLPGSFAELGASLQKYLEIVFARKKISTAPPFMRGIYFTSSERKGAAISKALRDLGIQPVDQEWPNLSFFNKDVFGQKVFRETLLVTTADSVDRMRRGRKIAAYLTGMAAALLLAGLSVWSFFSVSGTIGDVTSFYSELGKVWPSLEAANWKGKGAEELHISNSRATACSSLADIIQKSAEFSGKQVRTSPVFLPIRLFAGDIGMSEDRKMIHRELVSRTLLRPVLQKSLDAMAKPSTWSVESFGEAKKLKLAGAALATIVHFGNILESGDTIDPGDSINLMALLEFLKDQKDPEATDWLASDQAARLSVLLVGSKATASSEAVSGALAKADVVKYKEYKDCLDAAKVTVAIEAFRREIASQVAGQSGLARRIKDLETTVNEAVAAPKAFAEVTDKGKVDTYDAYTKFCAAWDQPAAMLDARVKDTHARFAALGVSEDWLARLTAFMDDLVAQYHAVEREVGSVSDATVKKLPKASADTIAAWKTAIGSDKPVDFTGKSNTEMAATTSLKRCESYCKKVQPGELSPLQTVASLAMKVNGFVKDKPEPKSTSDTLIWNPQAAAEAAREPLNDSQDAINAVKASSAAWTLPTEVTAFVASTADQYLAALAIVRRRAVGVQMESYIATLASAPSLSEALSREAVSKGVTPPKFDLPMTRLNKELHGNLPAEFSSETVVRFFRGWDAVNSEMCSSSGTEPAARPAGVPEGAIVNRLGVAGKCAIAMSAVSKYKGDVVEFWNEKIIQWLSPVANSWPDYLSELGALKAYGATPACESLKKIQEMRQSCFLALKEDPNKSRWKWSALADPATARDADTWLGLWFGLPANDSLEARRQVKSSKAWDSHRALCDVPYWHEIALAGLVQLGGAVGRDAEVNCAKFLAMAGLPLMRGAGFELKEVDRAEVARLARALKSTAQMAQPEQGGHALDGAGAGNGPSCTLDERAKDLEHALSATCSKVSQTTCDLAQLLTKDIALTIQPGMVPPGASPETLITRTYPHLSVPAINRPIRNFKIAIDKFSHAAPAKGDVVWEFNDKEDGGGNKIILTFKPWHVLDLLAVGKAGGVQASSKDGVTWDVYIPDIGKCSAFTVDKPVSLSLALTITVDGGKLPIDDAWPTAPDNKTTP